MVAKPLGFYQRLQQLPLPAQQAFMAALCERLLPNYALYQQTTGLGDEHTLRTVLSLVWERLSVPNASIDFARQAEKLAECEPPEDDESFGARRALDAVVSVSALLDTLQGESPEAVLDVSRTSRAGVRAFIELTEGEEDAQALALIIRDHPLMADENDFQDAVLDAVSEPINKASLKEIRQLGRNNGISNLGLTLDEGEE
ncbi:YjaG family protein [Halomonas qinghailakensis]|uniref:YjaG family protein n=2 Tax=Halomonas TaxID=2745 RepID=A0AA46TT02_9GAMM|nr:MULTISPECIES: YjaG family protein [Halomonas]UYO75569.1 YjaG family protein [Halomonas sp. ZZQ-149]UYV19560.1 YjaG family protein [Halomonas qaidamensis]